jgi:hypothetical protein
MSNQINLVINGKGGVGKSFFAKRIEAATHYEPFVFVTSCRPWRELLLDYVARCAP